MQKRTSLYFIGCLLTLCLLSLVPGGAQTERPKNICKATHLGPMAVAINCTNGADPTGHKLGDTLIISCGKLTDK